MTKNPSLVPWYKHDCHLIRCRYTHSRQYVCGNFYKDLRRAGFMALIKNRSLHELFIYRFYKGENDGSKIPTTTI